MTASADYRRLIVVDRAVATRNVALLKERTRDEPFVVWSKRRSGMRFLDGFREIAAQLEVAIVGGDAEPEREVRLTQILGGHPLVRNAVALETHLLSLRRVAAGDGVSYGATFVAPEDMVVGLAPVGFADGLDRRLSGNFIVSIGGVPVPVIGRIAMDSISLDCRSIPDVVRGSTVTIYGDDNSGGTTPRAAAEALGISAVEIIARLSERAEVIWR